MIRLSKYLEVFNLRINIHVYDNMDKQMEAEKRFSKREKWECEEFCHVRGMTFKLASSDIFYVFFARDQLDLDVVSHECAHLTHAILKHHNMNKKEDTETYALLLGYLTSTIAKKLKTKGIKLGS